MSSSEIGQRPAKRARPAPELVIFTDPSQRSTRHLPYNRVDIMKEDQRFPEMTQLCHLLAGDQRSTPLELWCDTNCTSYVLTMQGSRGLAARDHCPTAFTPFVLDYKKGLEQRCSCKCGSRGHICSEAVSRRVPITHITGLCWDLFFWKIFRSDRMERRVRNCRPNRRNVPLVGSPQQAALVMKEESSMRLISVLEATRPTDDPGALRKLVTKESYFCLRFPLFSNLAPRGAQPLPATGDKESAGRPFLTGSSE